MKTARTFGTKGGILIAFGLLLSTRQRNVAGVQGVQCVSLSPRICIRSGDRRRLETETDKVSRTLLAWTAYLPCISIHFGPGPRM
jgi:hypothetical protein